MRDRGTKTENPNWPSTQGRNDIGKGSLDKGEEKNLQNSLKLQKKPGMWEKNVSTQAMDWVLNRLGRYWGDKEDL